MTVFDAAVLALDAANERVLSADSDGVTYDHVAAEAFVAIAGALESAERDEGAAILILRVVAELLAELPAAAGHGALQDLLRVRVRERARYAQRNGAR